MLFDTITSLLRVKSVTKTESFVVLKNAGMWMMWDVFADLGYPGGEKRGDWSDLLGIVLGIGVRA